MSETQEFGATIRELRVKAHLTQQEVADKAGIDSSYLSQIESGVLPPPSEQVILKLAKALKVDKDELMALAGKLPSDIARILRSRDPRKFGTKIRELRIKAHLTQQELADKIGIDFTYLSKIESGAKPSPSRRVILQLAETLNADKDELLVWGGKTPSDIAQMLEKREPLRLLKNRAREEVKTSNQVGGIQMNYKYLARVAIAITLVIAIGTSLWYAAPPPVRALTTAASVANSPISGNTTYLLGENITIPAYIQFGAQEFKGFEHTTLEISGPESFTKELPLVAGTYNYADEHGTLNVVVSWGTGVSAYAGYSGYYGYGYATGTGKINYQVKWKPPYLRSVSPTPPPTVLPGADINFELSPLSDNISTDYWAYLSYPQGIADNSTYLYTLVPAYYTPSGETAGKDLIIKTTLSGSYVSSFAAPGDPWSNEALTFVGSNLYVAYNAWDAETWTVKGKVSKHAGADNWTIINGLSNLNPIGGLASDGTNLFVAYRDTLRIDKRSPSTGALISSFDLSTAWGGGGGMGFGPPIWGFDALAYSTDLYAAQGETIIKVDASTGSKTGEYKTAKWSIRGLDFVSETWSGTAYDVLYLAVTDGNVYKSSKPGAVPVVEYSPIGDYTARFRVVTAGFDQTRTATFTLAKLSVAPVITITTPAPNFAVGTGSENITVTGIINDPSIATVTVGVTLPEVTAFQDDVENAQQSAAKWQHSAVSGMNIYGPTPYASDDLWHRSSVRSHGSGSSWRYADSSSGTYETNGFGNAGALRTKTATTIGTDNKLTFWTWYDGELDFWPDRKRVEVSSDNITWQPIAWLAKFWPPFTPPDISASEYSTLRQVPERTWTKVEVSLASYAGQNIYIRFRFDTMDSFANDFEGWYIDDVSITGAGFEGKTVSVGDNLQFTTTFTLAEGSNVITVNAQRTNYAPLLTGSTSVTGSLDQTSPDLTLNSVTTPTNQQYQLISGRVVDANFDRLELKVDTGSGYQSKWSTTVLGTNGAFSQSILLAEGNNAILIEARDKVGLTDNATALIKLDTTGPVFEAVFPGSDNLTYDVAYMTGEISARPNDFFVIALKVTDAASAIASVKLATPNQPESQWPSAMLKTGLPEAVIDSWGIKASTKSAMNYLIPMQLPSGLPAGEYSWTVKAWDTAGNLSQQTVKTNIVTTLEAFNIYLLPDWNLVSTPLIPTTDNITTLTTAIRATGLLERVWYYDASQAGTAAAWKLYEPGLGGDLTKLETGKGYWFKMANLAAFSAAGKVSGPMASGLPNTPAPVKLSIAGQVLQPGAVVPPTYAVYAGWNLIGLHSEQSRPVSTAFSSVTVPTQKWGSLLQYLNYISFPMRGEASGPEIDLGRFDRLISTGTMQPGRGFWLYMVESGTIVP